MSAVAGRWPLWLGGLALVAAAVLAPVRASAQESDADLAKKLNNPVSAMISVPLQLNYDCCFGPDDGNRYTLNIQPVIPFSLNAKWNLITRTILPVIEADRSSPQAAGGTGVGDITQSFFLSPKAEFHGLIWGAGPVFLWPVGSAGFGSGKWGAGPTFVVLKQEGGLTLGLLANHIWSYADAGHSGQPEVNSTFLQPFVAWTSPKATTVTFNTESSYNWRDGRWSVPLNLTVTHLFKIGGQRVQIGGGGRVYVARDAPSGQGPDWGLRFVTTFLFPK
jgi:hypothetical protein